MSKGVEEDAGGPAHMLGTGRLLRILSDSGRYWSREYDEEGAGQKVSRER
jgi:hypothetical protein